MKLPVSVGNISTSANRQAVVMETLAGEERPIYKLKRADMIKYL